MSLHILRHKKWHVWNQENEDIFARDEREYMEKVEAEEKNERMNAMSKRIQQMKERNGIQEVRQHPLEGSCIRFIINFLDSSTIPPHSIHLQSDITEKADISYNNNEDYKVRCCN